MYTNNESDDPKGSGKGVEEVWKPVDTMRADALKIHSSGTIALGAWIQEMDTLRNWSWGQKSRTSS